MKEGVAKWLTVVPLMTFAFCAGMLVGIQNERDINNQWALDNGYAHYDQRTGELILHEKGGE